MTIKEQNFISAVIYVHNNQSTLKEFLGYIGGYLKNKFSNYEIICVNDGSTDDSEAIIREAALSEEMNLTLVNMGNVQGVEHSMNAGLDLAIGDFVLEFDSAVKTWPDDIIDQVYGKMQEGADIVSACPDSRPRFTSRVFYAVFNKYANTRNPIGTEAFRLLSRRAVNRVSSMNRTQMYRKAVNANSALKQASVTFTPTENANIEKALSKERRSLAVDSLLLFTNVGYKVSLIITLVMLAFAFIVGVYTVIVFITGRPVEGWTPIMIFLSLGFFGLFAILTFCVKYLSLILNLNFKRRHYVVENVEKL
ncbi:MAG: glycosyltransferase [Parasporobacterium sp.]|nr:glycosyltransferase [Parasporobacterium sp.]